MMEKLGMYCKVTMLIVVLICFKATVDGQTQNDETRLISNLFENENNGEYNPQVRPANLSNETVEIQVGIIVGNVLQVDSKQQSLLTHSCVVSQWKDYRLTWNSSLYNGLDNILISSAQVWRPDFVLKNSNNMFPVGINSVPVKLYSDGVLLQQICDTITSHCAVDVTYYPYDQQGCLFPFVNLASSLEQVSLTFFGNETDANELFATNLQSTILSGRWSITDSKVSRRELSNVLYVGNYSQVNYALVLERHTHVHVSIVILLNFFAVIMLASLFLPLHTGDKVTLGITTLVIFAILYHTVTSDIQESTDKTPLLMTYLTVYIAINAAVVLESVYVIYLQRTKGQKSVHHRVWNSLFRKLESCWSGTTSNHKSDRRDDTQDERKPLTGNGDPSYGTAAAKENEDEMKREDEIGNSGKKRAISDASININGEWDMKVEEEWSSNQKLAWKIDKVFYAFFLIVVVTVNFIFWISIRLLGQKDVDEITEQEYLY